MHDDHRDPPLEPVPNASLSRKNLWVSIMALFFSLFLPLLLLLIGRFLSEMLIEFVLLLLLSSPIAGFFLGVIALSRRKTDPNRVAFVLALLAMVIPLLYVGFVVLAFTVPGLVNLM